MKKLTKKQWTIVGTGIGGLVFISLLTMWFVYASGAENKASQLVTACADLARCLAGDKVKLDRADVNQEFERRMVAELPHINTVKHCVLALDVVEEKWNDYRRVWFNSSSSKAPNGNSLGDNFQTAYDAFRKLPVDKTTDEVFLRQAKYGSMLQAGNLAFDMYDAARAMLANEGANTEQVTRASETRMRKAPHDPERVPQGNTILTVDGKVKPSNWRLIPSQKGLVLHALTDHGQMRLAYSNNGTSGWKQLDGPAGFASNPDLTFRVIDAPGPQRWYIVTYGKVDQTERFVGKIGDSSVAKPEQITAPPNEWKRIPGNENEVVALADDWKAFSVWRIVEKTPEDKKEEKKQREEWNKNFADKEVQALVTLAEQRRLAHAALGIDDDHKRLDGIAYVKQGAQASVLELPGFGVAGLVADVEPMVLVGEQEIPAQKLGLGTIPPPGEPLGPMAEGGSLKPLEPRINGSPWHRCISSDHTHWVTTTTGNFLIAMRPGSLEVVPMAALADDTSHLGCGEAVATVALELKKDNIFGNLLTIRGQETEGAKIHITAGTSVAEYNTTASSAAASNGTVIGWIARGYAFYAVNFNSDHEFGAPLILGYASTNGSKISGVHFVGQGTKLFAALARQACQNETTCTTSFELLVSEDGAKTWKSPE